MCLVEALGTAIVGAPIASAVAQNNAANKSRKAQQRANAIQKAQASVEQARARRKQVAEARIARARNIAQAGIAGIDGSSALFGANSSLSSNAASNSNQLNRSFVSGQQTFDLRQQAAFAEQRGQQQANIFGAVGSLANLGLDFMKLNA